MRRSTNHHEAARCAERRPHFAAPLSRPSGSRGSATGLDSLALSRARPGAFRYLLKGDALWWSNAVAEAFGREPGYAPRNFEHFLAMVHDDDRDQVIERVARALKTREPYEADAKVVWPDGSVATLRTRVEVELGENDEVLGLVGETELLAVAPPSAPRDERRPRTDIGHDLKNVMQLLASEVDLAKLQVRGALSVETVEGALASLASLSHELLGANPRGAENLVCVDLVRWIRERAPRLAQSATNRRRTVLTIRAHEGLNVMVNEARLLQTLTSLINNAREATYRGAEIHLKLREEEGVAVLEVADNGTGIAEDLVDRVWARGYTTKGAGHGFGLAGAREAVSEMGGWIRLQSQKGVGTKVSIFLPVIPRDYDA